MLTNIYRGDYDTDADIEPAILEATREIFSRSVDKGIKQSHFDPSASFKKQIHHSADVFSAFRVHTMTKEVVSRLHDDNGRLRSFSEFAEAVQPYVSHQNRAWLQTEYSTAVRRAHDAADWQQFEAEKDVLPNLRWMPSTSAKPGQDHMEFWGTVLPVDDPFWKEHRPGDRWNCKCSLSSTDDEPTSRPAAKESTPQPGLKTKPTDAELFSQDHPYYADSCTSCPFKGSKLMALLHDLSGKRDCNSCGGVNSKLEGEEKRKPFKNTTDAVKVLSNGDGKTVDAAMRYIAKSKDFKPSDKNKDIFITPGFKHDKDKKNLMQAALKAVEHGNRVWILPNPENVKTPDYLFQKGQSLRIYDLKKITGKGSVETDLKKAKGQSRRFVLDITPDYNPRSLIKEIKRAFEYNSEMQEVLIYKGKKEISINSNYLENSGYIRTFLRDWAK